MSAADLDGNIGGKEYIFPACARAPVYTPRVVGARETIESFYRGVGIPVDAQMIDAASAEIEPASSQPTQRIECLRSGRGGASYCTYRGFAAAENADRFLKANPSINARMMVAGLTEIKLPQAPVWSTVVLRPGVSVDEALRTIQSAGSQQGGDTAVEVARASVANLIADIPISDGSCAAAAPGWPFSSTQFEEALSTNRRTRPGGVIPRKAKILILDTGFDDQFLVRAVPLDYLGHAMAPGLTSGAAIHSSVNLAMWKTGARPPSNLPNRLHGSEVAATLLGGSILEQHRSQLSIPVQMIFASLATVTNNESYLSSRAINSSLRYARQNSIPIINGSVFASENRQDFLEALDNSGLEVLLITAAGNNSQPFENDNLTWPGALGGELSNGNGSLIVTVGSHDSTGRISAFSRRGSQHVDLLAPGCEVPTFSLKATGGGVQVAEVKRSGTSYAAPIVSLTAAYLYAEGLNPPDIKARLLISVDMDAALDDVAYSSGRLNITKALSVWQDTVEYLAPPNAGGERVIARSHGSLALPNSTVKACNRTVTQGSIRKLSIYGNSQVAAEPKKVIMWWQAAGKPSYDISKIVCEAQNLSGQDLILRDEGGAEISIALTDVRDYISKSLE